MKMSLSRLRRLIINILTSTLAWRGFYVSGLVVFTMMPLLLEIVKGDKKITVGLFVCFLLEKLFSEILI